MAMSLRFRPSRLCKLPQIPSKVRPIQLMLRVSKPRYSSTMQSVAQPSFWASLVPKPLRRGAPHSRAKPQRSTQWNPATFYIIIFLLIGSMSIQMIALRNEFSTFIRRSDAKIDLLREVIEKVKRGETVDVEGLLGSKDAEKEKEWEEVLKEIENEDALWATAEKKRSKSNTEVQPAIKRGQGERDEAEAGRVNVKTNAPRGFF